MQSEKEPGRSDPTPGFSLPRVMTVDKSVQCCLARRLVDKLHAARALAVETLLPFYRYSPNESRRPPFPF